MHREVDGSGGLWWAESTITHSGSGALGLDMRSAVPSGTQDYRLVIGPQNPVPVTPGEQYVASVWARLDEAAPSTFTVGLLAFFYDSLGEPLTTDVIEVHTFTQSTGFQEYPPVTFTVPAQAADLYLVIRAPDDDLLYVDDVCLGHAD